jgi:hypothetical protein
LLSFLQKLKTVRSDKSSSFIRVCVGFNFIISN